MALPISESKYRIVESWRLLLLVEEEEKEFNRGSSSDQDTLPLELKHLSSIDDVKNKKTPLIVSFRVS